MVGIFRCQRVRKGRGPRALRSKWDLELFYNSCVSEVSSERLKVWGRKNVGLKKLFELGPKRF